MSEKIPNSETHAVLLNPYSSQGFIEAESYNRRPATRIGFSISPPLTQVFDATFLNKANQRLQYDKRALNEAMDLSNLQDFELTHSDAHATYGSFIVRQVQSDIRADEAPMIRGAEMVFTEALYPDGRHISIDVSTGGRSGSES
jgi:hypothetical protein